MQTDLTSIIQNNTDEQWKNDSTKPLLKATSKQLLIIFIRNKLTCDTNAATVGLLAKLEAEWSDYLQQQMAFYDKRSGEEFDIIKENPYSRIKLGDEAVDQVQTDIKTYRLEQEYLTRRNTQIILPALERLCSEQRSQPANLRRPINIAIVASGGGSRAMNATLGALKGLHEIGVLPTVSYICGLSGSTWAINKLYTEINKNKLENVSGEAGLARNDVLVRESINNAIKLSLKCTPGFDFLQVAIIDQLARLAFKDHGTVDSAGSKPRRPLGTPNGPDIKGTITEILARLVTRDRGSADSTGTKAKQAVGQPTPNTDHYADAIALLNGHAGDTALFRYRPDYLSHHLGQGATWQYKDMRIAEDYVALLPFPVYTAIMHTGATKKHLPWFEFTPYQVGTVIEDRDKKIGMFVKTFAFGRRFENGRSLDYAPEQPLEFFLGVCGSAMNCRVEDAAPEAICKHLSEDFKHREFGKADVLNPMYHDQRFGTFASNQVIGLADAGVGASNLPYPVLNDFNKQRAERKPDIVIFIDASADSAPTENPECSQTWANGTALKDVTEYARIHKFDFPNLPSHFVVDKTCHIINSHEQDKPVLIYLPLMKKIDELSHPDLMNGVIRHYAAINYMPSLPLCKINLSRYRTEYTAMEAQDAVNLMAIMHCNVFNNRQIIKQEICNRATSMQ